MLIENTVIRHLSHKTSPAIWLYAPLTLIRFILELVLNLLYVYRVVSKGVSGSGTFRTGAC